MESKINSKAILITFMIGEFFAVLNETLLNIALTKLMTVFNVDAPTVQWLATGFMLVMGVLMPISALLIQWFTTRQMFIGVITI
jgi:DHA2 family lincomycin resistance protein-like MFS transporter